MSKAVTRGGNHHAPRSRLLGRGTTGPARNRQPRGRGVLRAGALAVVAAGLVLVAFAVGTGRWQIEPVLSGSMRPGLPVGGVVVSERVPLSSLQVGDVAVFHPPGTKAATYVHRIVSLQDGPGGVVVHTKGDANLDPDPWALRLHGRWAYEARFSLPLVGYPAVWIHSPGGRRALLVAAGVLFALLAASVAVDLRRRDAARAATSLTAVSGEAGDRDT